MQPRQWSNHTVSHSDGQGGGFGVGHLDEFARCDGSAAPDSPSWISFKTVASWIPFRQSDVDFVVRLHGIGTVGTYGTATQSRQNALEWL